MYSLRKVTLLIGFSNLCKLSISNHTDNEFKTKHIVEQTTQYLKTGN